MNIGISDIDPSWPIGSSFPEDLQGVENLRRVYGSPRDALVTDVRMWSLRFSSSEARDAFIEALRRDACRGEKEVFEVAEVEGVVRYYLGGAAKNPSGFSQLYDLRYSIIASVPDERSVLVFCVDEDAWATAGMSSRRIALRGGSSLVLSVSIGVILGVIFYIFGREYRSRNIFSDIEPIPDFVPVLLWSAVFGVVAAACFIVWAWGARANIYSPDQIYASRLSFGAEFFLPMWGDFQYFAERYKRRFGDSPDEHPNDISVRNTLKKNRLDTVQKEICVSNTQMNDGHLHDSYSRKDGAVPKRVGDEQFLACSYPSLFELGLANPLWWGSIGLNDQSGSLALGEWSAPSFYSPTSYVNEYDSGVVYTGSGRLFVPAVSFTNDWMSDGFSILSAILSEGGGMKTRDGSYYFQSFHRVPKAKGLLKNAWYAGPATGVMAFGDVQGRIHLTPITSEVLRQDLMKVYVTRVLIGLSLALPVICGGATYFWGTGLWHASGLNAGQYLVGCGVLVFGLLLFLATLHYSIPIWRRLLWHLRNDGLYTYPDLLQAEEAVKRASAALVARGWREVPQEEWGMVRQEVREEAKARMQRQAAERLARAQLLIAEQGEYLG